MTAPSPSPSRRERHPARRARRVAGALSAAAVVTLAGCLRLAAPGDAGTGTAPTSGTSGTDPTASDPWPGDGGRGWEPSGEGWDDDGSAADPWGAQPGTPSPSPDTSTSGS